MWKTETILCIQKLYVWVICKTFAHFPAKLIKLWILAQFWNNFPICPILLNCTHFSHAFVNCWVATAAIGNMWVSGDCMVQCCLTCGTCSTDWPPSSIQRKTNKLLRIRIVYVFLCKCVWNWELMQCWWWTARWGWPKAWGPLLRSALLCIIIIIIITATIRGCPHITAAARGGEGVGQMLTIADKGGLKVPKMCVKETN